jgi:hypothetical protein
MRRTWLPVLFLVSACETTPEAADEPGSVEAAEITIPADDLEPMNRFLLETRRLLFADFVRVEVTPQYFEERMGFTRDVRFVSRKQWTEGTTRIIEFRNDSPQETNVDPDLLPRIKFGDGLEVRAFRVLRVYLRPPEGKERPLALRIEAKGEPGDAKLWTGGRLEHEQPKITIRSELIWSEERQRYSHRASVG